MISVGPVVAKASAALFIFFTMVLSRNKPLSSLSMLGSGKSAILASRLLLTSTAISEQAELQPECRLFKPAFLPMARKQATQTDTLTSDRFELLRLSSPTTFKSIAARKLSSLLIQTDDCSISPSIATQIQTDDLSLSPSLFSSLFPTEASVDLPLLSAATVTEGKSFATAAKTNSKQSSEDYWKDKECYKCGEKGHPARRCPNDDKDKKKKKGKKGKDDDSDNESKSSKKSFKSAKLKSSKGSSFEKEQAKLLANTEYSMAQLKKEYNISDCSDDDTH
jgi:Zinc knuckle